MITLKDKRVLVMGLGRFGGGIGVTQFLVSQGAIVRVTDQLNQTQLHTSLKALKNLPIDFVLGQHRIQDFQNWAEIVVVNPAVKPQANKYLEAAEKNNVKLTTEIQILLQRLPNPQQTVAITGTNGKSTTLAMLGHILQKCLKKDAKVWLGGNIGGSLLTKLSQIKQKDIVVLELSSFMLERLRNTAWAPAIAVITNIAPNHTDWHGSHQAYLHAKQVILNKQIPNNAAFLGPGAENFITQDFVIKGIMQSKPKTIDIPIPGPHNQQNAHMALAVCQQLKIDITQARQALKTFNGLPHRMQRIGQHQNVQYFNDSKATTPQAAILAIQGFQKGKVHAILGGYDKGTDLSKLAKCAAKHCKAIYTIGQTAQKITQAIQTIQTNPTNQPNPTNPAAQINPTAQNLNPTVLTSHHLDTAMHQIQKNTQPNDIVLLSPGCASWGQFENFEKRGQAFTTLFKNLT